MIETRPLADSPELRTACEALLEQPPDVLVATTGVGIRSWMEAADGLGLGDRLRAVLADVEVLARSPKAAGALLTAELPLHWQASGERARDVLDHLEGRDLRGLRVAVQRDGAEEPLMAEELATLTLLAEAGGAVVPKAELARRAWGPGADPHVVEVTVARLRTNLGPAIGAVVTVPRRGYRLAAAPVR